MQPEPVRNYVSAGDLVFVHKYQDLLHEIIVEWPRLTYQNNLVTLKRRWSGTTNVELRWLQYFKPKPADSVIIYGKCCIYLSLRLAKLFTLSKSGRASWSVDVQQATGCDYPWTSTWFCDEIWQISRETNKPSSYSHGLVKINCHQFHHPILREKPKHW